jgi:type II secretory pathway pseudopilin PulG
MIYKQTGQKQQKTLSFIHKAYGILMGMMGGLQYNYRRRGSLQPRSAVSGFTIVETMIVLAVSGALFLAAALALSGRQHHTQFEQAIQDARSRIQQTINEVATGYYPNMNNFTCTPSAGGPVFAGGSTEQGGNKGCIFLGKAIQFKVGGTDPEQLRVYTIAGLQKTAAGDEITDYSQSSARVISYPSYDEASDAKPLLYGLTTSEVYFNNPAKTNIGSIAFVNSLASYNAGTIVSGAQQVKVIPILNSALNDPITTAATDIQGRVDKSPIDPDGIFICLVSGATDQSGLITIGSNGRQLSVTLEIKGNKTCS